MRKHIAWIFFLCMASLANAAAAQKLPGNFAYLFDVDDRIRQDIRYAGSHNFVGRPIAGYRAAECVLTRDAASALRSVQDSLLQKNLSLVVWDCYRPERAVADFIKWTSLADDQKMKAEFYPRVEKSAFFAAGYLAHRSGHSRGNSVDLGIVPIEIRVVRSVASPEVLKPCFADRSERFNDGTIDMGTGYDCLDALSATDHPAIRGDARKNRKLLADEMIKAGFRPYRKEWWHFDFNAKQTSKNSYDFEVAPRATTPVGVNPK